MIVSEFLYVCRLVFQIFLLFCKWFQHPLSFLCFTNTLLLAVHPCSTISNQKLITYANIEKITSLERAQKVDGNNVIGFWNAKWKKGRRDWGSLNAPWSSWFGSLLAGKAHTFSKLDWRIFTGRARKFHIFTLSLNFFWNTWI